MTADKSTAGAVQMLYCPKCGAQRFVPQGRKKLQCQQCEFQFFRNAACAVAVAIICDEEILVVTRAREPAKGQLDLPGGFVDPGENLEQAVIRELKEELDIEVSDMRYLMSGVNVYPYGGVIYDTTDVFFEVTYQNKPTVKALDDVAAVNWLPMQTLTLAQFAFASQREMLSRCYAL